MQPQGDAPDDFYQNQRQPEAYHTFQQDIVIQDPGGISTGASTSWVYYPSVQTIQQYPPEFPSWDAGPLDLREEPETLLPEGSIEPFLYDVGGNPNPGVMAGYGDSSRGGPWLGGDFPRYDANTGSPTHLTISTSMASLQHHHPLHTSLAIPSDSSNSYLMNALTPDPTREDRPKSTEEHIQPQDGFTDSVGTGSPRESRNERDKLRQRKRRDGEEIFWKELKDTFGEKTTRYDSLYKAGILLGIPIPSKEFPSRKRRTAPLDPYAKAERKRQEKNESGREETRRVRVAIDIIRRHFKMRKANRHETLARLVEAVRGKKLEEGTSHAQAPI